jgi:DNA-binding IclR family transcriptional regulator
VLAQINGLEATYLLVFEPAHPLVFRQNVGDRVSSLYASSGGKALLGTLDEAALDAAMTSISFKPLTAYTVASEGELRQQIERGRARGWYVNQEETLEGVTTVSATFAWHASNYIVTVAGPSSRVTPKLDATGRALALLMEQLAAGSAQK